jgi:hypothetical protein
LPTGHTPILAHSLGGRPRSGSAICRVVDRPFRPGAGPHVPWASRGRHSNGHLRSNLEPVLDLPGGCGPSQGA